MQPEEIIKVNYEAFKKHFSKNNYTLLTIGGRCSETMTHVAFAIVENGTRIIVNYSCSHNIFEASSNGGILALTHTLLNQWINFVDEVEGELRKYAAI